MRATEVLERHNGHHLPGWWACQGGGGMILPLPLPDDVDVAVGYHYNHQGRHLSRYCITCDVWAGPPCLNALDHVLEIRIRGPVRCGVELY